MINNQDSTPAERQETEESLKQTLKKLQSYKDYLEIEVTARTKELMEQDKMLWSVNNIAQKLLAFDGTQNFNTLVYECLKIVGELTGKNRVFIWKDVIPDNGKLCCIQVYEWVQGVPSVQNDPNLQNVPYENLPAFLTAIQTGKCLNSLICNLSKAEREILEPQDIKAILIAPVSINGKNWGFIGIDNCETEQRFTDIEENTLLLSGFLLANAIQRNETEAKVRAAEELNQLMLNAMPLCCNLWNRQFENTACNDEAVRLFELSDQKSYLDNFDKLSPERQPNGILSSERAHEKIAKAFKDGYCRFEWLHQKLNGEPIPTEVTLVRVKHRDDYIVAGYTRDLREQKAMLAQIYKAKAELNAAYEEAMLSSQAKTNFLANMSHEIRTPMNAISGLAEIILRESRGRAAAEYATSIKHACNNLLNIINDILDISKIESGKLEICNAEYYLASLLNDVINIARFRLENKPLIFLTDIDSRLPSILFGDEMRIKQILTNMLSNAIKFTQNGHIQLNVSGETKGELTTLVFTVADTGCGIRKKDQERLFVEFERINTTKNRSIEGTGLGLAISKRLCEMMGGTISLQSDYGKGSVFTVTIPQQCKENLPLAQAETSKSVLLYEPRELYANSIVQTIENLGCSCTLCKNQSELTEKLTIKKFDYIFTSSMHLRKVKIITQKENYKTALVLLSNLGETVSEPGITTIFLPVNCLQVAAVLNNSVSTNFNIGQKQDSNQFIAPSATILIVDDNPVNLTVAAGLMKPYQFTIETAENGLEAVEKIQRRKYDLVFMDHMMPEMDGIDATNAIRALEGDYYKTLPIIALTANALVGTREMFINEGMNDFLAKPIEMGKLNTILLKWLPAHLQQSPLQPPSHKEKTPLFLIDGVNTAEGLTSVGGNVENYLHILAVYHADGLKKSRTLLTQSLKKNINAFRIDIHSLKSASASIGAFSLSAYAQKLEKAAADNNTTFIEEHIESFLHDLKTLLERIKPYVSTSMHALQTESAEKPHGNSELLKTETEKLHEALDFVNLPEIEHILQRLQPFSWPPVVADNLLKIQNAVSLFNYDEAMEYLNRIQEHCSN